jgi:hypothetical protein
MDWTMVGAVGEVLGGAGVIVSLLYLASQVRVGSRADQSARFEGAQDAVSDWTQSLATDAELAEIVLRGATQGGSALRPVELWRFYASLNLLFRSYERMCMYDREGVVHHWGKEAFDHSLRDLLGFPGFRQYWSERRHWFVPVMQREVDALLAGAGQTLMTAYGDEGQTS